VTGDADRLLQDFAARWRAGERPDLDAFAAGLDGLDRAEFLARAEAFVARAPRRRWDPDAFRGSAAESVVEQLEPSLGGVAGLWPSVLPDLRHRARITRRALVDQLAEQLGVGAQREKVAAYYHQMEQGTLAAAGVSQRVLDVLGGLLSVSGERLRQAGEAIAPAGAGEGTDPVFARRAMEAPPPAAAAAPPPAFDEAPRSPERLDEVDRLFRAG